MIVQARGALETLFDNAGFNVSAFVPERITPPIAVIAPSGDWVQSGDTFGSFRVGFDVTLITPTASNAKVTDELDQMVDDALDTVSGAAGFYASQVSAPTLLSVQNAEFLSTTITIYQNTQL
jgi:hypothetical protein